MFDKLRLQEVLVQYKKDFAVKQWENEKYKWEAIKCFQDNWNVNAPDFYEMLHRALGKTNNLLTSANNFPRAMIEGFAKSAPEEVRAMFIELFDESKDLYERINTFKTKSAILLEMYSDGIQHYQYENTISIYLWLRYPDKYYIYKFGAVKTVSKILESNYYFKKGAYADNIRNFYKFYDEICVEIQQDKELVDLLKNSLTDLCYPDPELRTLTGDIGFYISRLYSQKDVATSNSEDEPFTKKHSDELSDELKEAALSSTDLYVQTSPEDKSTIEPYSKKDFLEEVFITEQKYDILVSVLQNKKNIILQGAPGVGKTFTAKRLVYSMMNEKNDDRIEFVQFHQNYTYEDFVMGYKPVEDRFELKYGLFYRFCQKAANDSKRDYYFIIDEINRGNLSKIFGELLMLIERDYRDTQATLAYNNCKFFVPSNLYIIGMMNTADRSLAMIDYALRRRFSFFEMEPGFDTEGFIKYQNKLNSETFDELILKVKDLNAEIARDRALGKGFCIGHSYFCQMNICTDEWLKEVVDYDILPMLSEYWFDDADKLIRWENILHGVFQ